MSRKISDFLTKKSVKLEESKNGNQSEISKENHSNLVSNENSGHENKDKVNENVKTEAEKDLIIDLPQQKVFKYPIPIKIEDNEPKDKKLSCGICKKTFSSLGHLKLHHKVHETEHKCTYCGKIFRHNCLMLTHINNIHENPGSFKCGVCQVGFNSKNNLIAHQRVHNKDYPKPFKCSKCDFATDHNPTFKRHLKIHERIIEKCNKCSTILSKNRAHDCRLDCQFCGKLFKNYSKTAEHIKKCHAHETERSFYECDIFGCKLRYKTFLMQHMEVKHPDGKNEAFTCDLDGKIFNFKKQLRGHMKTHLPQVKCDFCFKKLTISHLKEHITNFHTGIKPEKQPRKILVPKNKIFQCQICFNILSAKSSLDRHIRDHNKTIKCKFCEKLFGDQTSLKAHIRDIHDNPEGYICKICDKRFTQSADLRFHQKVHDPNRTKKFKCLECSYAFDKNSQLEKHLNSHKRKNAKIAAMQNPQKCPKCPAVLKSKKTLYSHMSSVHPKVLFECDICGRNIKAKTDMLSHFRSIHKIEN